jgi:hypothetical protein
MRQLKPTVDILLGLSTCGIFGEGIGLVRLNKSTYPLTELEVHHPSYRDFHQRKRYLPVLVSYSQMYPFACLPLPAALTPKS